MRIYTRTGDDGTTALLGGQRVSKADPRVEAYGTIDEANAAIGLARAHGVPDDVDRVLEDVQNDLFTLGSELACAPGQQDHLAIVRVSAAEITRLERAIDAADATLPPLRSFILPGGPPAAAALHLARCIVRRAERQVTAIGGGTLVRGDVLIYLNRLSDLLFVLARRASAVSGVEEVRWRGSIHPEPPHRVKADAGQ